MCWLDSDTGEADTAAAAFTAEDHTAYGEAAPSLGADVLAAAAFAEVPRGSAEGFDCAALLPVAGELAAASEDPDVDELAKLIALASDLGA